MDNQINSLLPGNYPSISTSPELMQSPSTSSEQAPRCAQCPLPSTLLRVAQDRLAEGEGFIRRSYKQDDGWQLSLQRALSALA